jgi:hypothetical protein
VPYTAVSNWSVSVFDALIVASGALFRPPRRRSPLPNDTFGDRATTMTRPFPRRHDCETNGNRSVLICHMGYPMDGPGFQCDPFSCVMLSWIYQWQGTTNTHTNAQACWGDPPHNILWYMKHACQHADGAHPPGPQRLTPFSRSCIHTLLLNRRSVGLLKKFSCHPGYSVDGSDPIVAGTTARRLHYKRRWCSTNHTRNGKRVNLFNNSLIFHPYNKKTSM